MARRHKKIQTDEAEVNITPMMDIVFILLIFFIVTASFTKEAGLEVTKPNNTQEQQQKQAKNILIVIDDTNQVFINHRPIDIRSVTANVQKLRAENPDGAVVVQTSEKSKNGTFVKVMDYTRLAGVQDIAIVAK